jgi:hypothetical protein
VVSHFLDFNLSVNRRQFFKSETQIKMSCGGGNRFVCGMRRFDKHSFTPDKPTNPELYNDNNKRLQELLNQRAMQDKGIFNTADKPEVNYDYFGVGHLEEFQTKK